MNDLTDFTNSYEFEEYGRSDLTGVRLVGNSLKLFLDFHTDNSDVEQSWEVECINFLEHQVAVGPCEGPNLHYDHVLLWPHIYPEASVSFYGEAKDCCAVVAALYKSHLQLAGDWIPFDRFMNGNVVEMIRGRYGMLAKGPTPLIESYAKVLESFEIGARITDPKPAYYTNDELSGLAEVAVLILSKRVYVVAPKFIARRLRVTEI